MTKSRFPRQLTLASVTSMATLLFTQVQLAAAQIRNPAIGEELGGDVARANSGVTFLSYFVTLWRAVNFMGALLVIIYFMWGGIEWITAGGDAAKVGKARDKITQATVGLIILVGSFTLIGLISAVFFGDQFNILNPTIPTPDNVSTGGGGNWWENLLDLFR